MPISHCADAVCLIFGVVEAAHGRQLSAVAELLVRSAGGAAALTDLRDVPCRTYLTQGFFFFFFQEVCLARWDVRRTNVALTLLFTVGALVSSIAF